MWWPKIACLGLTCTLVTGCADDSNQDTVVYDGSTDGGAVHDGNAVHDGSADGRASDAGPGGDAANRDGDASVADAAKPDASATPPLQIWMATDGDDNNEGQSLAQAVQTLARVQALIAERMPVVDVEVRIAPGTYRGQTVRWKTSLAEHRIRFMPAGDDKVRPVFDGCLSENNCPGGTWFHVDVADGRETRLHFEYIHVKRYQTAISFNGNRNSEATSNGSNRLYGCYFEDIGNGFNAELRYSTAAVRLVNSDDNEISNNHFVNVINQTSGALIHAIYVAHMSDRNRIERNRFYRSTGDPVRVRDYSNGNAITANRFIQVGTHAGYTDWYCDHDARTDCTKLEPECPSWLNTFRDNTLDGTWTCGALSAFHYFQDESTTGCQPPSADARRLRTSGNSTTAAPCSSQ